MKRLSLKSKVISGVLITVLCIVVFQIIKIKKTALNTLATERARLLELNRVSYEKIPLTPHLNQNLQIWQNTNDVRDIVRFEDSYFATTSGGLVQVSTEGKPIRHFTVLDGLPESDLTALTVFNNKLFIGTKTRGLVTFDSENFENYVWTDRQAQTITSFLEDNGRLFIGTFNGGLIEFDGQNFTEIKAEKERILSINCLVKVDAKLFVGTFNNGLWIYENDVWSHFTVAEGLPSNRIIGIAPNDQNLLVATDFGLSILQEKSFRTLFVLPSLSSFVSHDNQLFLTKENGDIFTYHTTLKEFTSAKNLQNTHLVSTNEKLWLLGNQGISQIIDSKIIEFNQIDDSLTDNFISALAFDKNQNLWIGTFRRGMDIFSASGKKIKHLESEKIRNINYLQANSKNVSAASSSGILQFKNYYSVENPTKKDGLPSDSIAHFSENVIATSKGLAFNENGKYQILSTIQGLPNNSIYTITFVGKKLYVGTLGGLAEIEGKKVVRTFKDSNSKLTTNWVAALVYTNERLFIGTYGGGVFELTASNEIRDFSGEISKFAVNPNAMFSDGERLYVGTLEGVKVLNLNTQEWKSIKNILPSETVMSITGDTENIYVATTNGIAKIGKSYFTKGESE